MASEAKHPRTMDGDEIVISNGPRPLDYWDRAERPFLALHVHDDLFTWLASPDMPVEWERGGTCLVSGRADDGHLCLLRRALLLLEQRRDADTATRELRAVLDEVREEARKALGGLLPEPSAALADCVTCGKRRLPFDVWHDAASGDAYCVGCLDGVPSGDLDARAAALLRGGDRRAE
jgi:hypothetical protein